MNSVLVVKYRFQSLRGSMDEPPRPLEAHHLHRARRPPDEAGHDVEAAADAHDHGHLEALAVLLGTRSP